MYLHFFAPNAPGSKKDSLFVTLPFKLKLKLIYFYVHCCSITKFRIHIHYIAVGEYKLLLPLLLAHEHNVDLLGCH